ncbi:hypothetical protein [Pseudoalteromonas sp. H105]|jgi:hypothetical protein|uniref:hypothetical protein n=1 Tax=Pseudoalteromonas sp. H105 TaxID=1348393 RepID=UPI000731FB0A|nr:hypothetical protein [Pseudoalteromonas sp. H105]KTF15107.1 hypothetical protein ATS75_09935 [Pseudoalteromonas sp. H105]
MNKLTITLCFSVCLTACGGGGDEKSTPTPVQATTATTTTSTVSTDTSTTEPASEGVMGLTIEDDFNLSTKFELDIDVNLNAGDQRAYLNVCYRKGDSDRADYNNCVVRTPLMQGMVETTIVMSRQDIDLVAEIWFYDASTEPLSYSWQFDTQQNDQVFEIR